MKLLQRICINFDIIYNHPFSLPYGICNGITPITEIKEFTKKLKYYNYEIIIVSKLARIDKNKEDIINYLKEYEITFDKIICEKVPCMIYQCS